MNVDRAAHHPDRQRRECPRQHAKEPTLVGAFRWRRRELKTAKLSGHTPSFIEFCGGAWRDEGARCVAPRRISSPGLRELPDH